jgi:hypothetical protein
MSTSPHLKDQLRNAVALAAKQDQIAWTVFGIFWAANAVLLVALFTSGDVPKPIVGVVVSLVGVVLSFIWSLIQRRALNWLTFYETVVQRLEERLPIPPDVALSGRRNDTLFCKVIGASGTRTRVLMNRSGIAATLAWIVPLSWFSFRLAATVTATSVLVVIIAAACIWLAWWIGRRQALDITASTPISDD